MNTVQRIENTFTDRFAADCARVSFGSNADDYSDEKVAGLIDHLVRHEHVNPFFHGMMSLAIPVGELNEVMLLQNKSALAGVNLYLDVSTINRNWIITASIWGWLKVAPYLCYPEEVFGIIGSKCPAIMDSYMHHHSLGVYGAPTGMYQECKPPRHHQWFTFKFETDMCTKAQLYTHTVGLAKSSQSFRYSDDIKFYVPDEWRGKADNVKQGCSDDVVDELYGAVPEDLSFRDNINQCLAWYQLNEHICNEQRRLILPQAQMSKYVITGTREAWERVIRLRSAPDAQKEVRDLMPVIQEALEGEWVG